MTPPLPERSRREDEPEVQGAPRSLISSLCGMAALLLGVGVVCVLYAAWDHFGVWVRVALLAVLPVVVPSLHVWWARRLGAPVSAPAFWLYLAANVALPPVGVYMAVKVAPLCGALSALLYALTMTWYGAAYRSSVVVSAAGMLCFAAAMSIPLYSGVGVVGGAVILILLGGAVLAAAWWLHRMRRHRLALLHRVQRRQEFSALQQQDPAPKPKLPEQP